MNSLRWRLVVAFSLVAVVPLALAMVLLSQRIQLTVRDQAADRLGSTLKFLEAQLRTDGERTLEKLQILGKDPVLKRLYLVRSPGGQDLAEYLAEQRFLLGLDFLRVTDPSGRVIADASTAPSVLARAEREGWHPVPTDSSLIGRLAIESVEGKAALAMAATGAIPYQSEVVGMVQGGVVLDAVVMKRLKQQSGVDLMLRDREGRLIVTTLASEAPILGHENASPSEPMRRGAAGVPESKQSGILPTGYLARSIPLERDQGQHYASITGLVSTAAADQTVAALRSTSVILGLMGVAIAIVLGGLWSLQVSRPVERLARFSQRIAQGDWDEPLALHSVRELETLVSALDRMRHDLRAYRERLVASERHAAWSLMARKVAHEIGNPLTPIAISIADLKRSYEKKRDDFPAILDQAVRTVGEEVQTLKRLLHEFSEFGRFPEPQFTRCRVTDVFADLETLYRREVAEGRLSFSGPAHVSTVRADRAQLRQALVNLIKNGLEAMNGVGRVEVGSRVADRALEIAVSDSGPGLSAEQRAHLFLPNFTTKDHGAGLGLTIVERIVNDHGGTIAVESTPGRGTTFRIRLPLGEGA